ncbi:hypothetical protein RJ639_033782, partial [Escallonia herrerae]
DMAAIAFTDEDISNTTFDFDDNFAEGGLADIYKELDWPSTLKVIKQAAGAIGYINGNGIVIRDFKLNKILIDQGKNIKLIDFGSARFGDGYMARKNEYYSAPEIIKANSNNASMGAGVQPYMVGNPWAFASSNSAIISRIPRPWVAASSSSTPCPLVKRMKLDDITTILGSIDIIMGEEVQAINSFSRLESLRGVSGIIWMLVPIFTSVLISTHKRCQDPKFNHVISADDLFIFPRAELPSLNLMQYASKLLIPEYSVDLLSPLLSACTYTVVWKLEGGAAVL